MTDLPTAYPIAVSGLRRYLGLVAYVYVCLCAIAIFKMTVVGGFGFWPFCIPVIKALLLAKLIGGVRPVGRGGDDGRRRRVLTIARRIVLFFALQVATSFIDAIIQACARGDPLSSAVPHISTGWLPESLATTLILLLVFIPYLNSRSPMDEERLERNNA